MSTPVITSIPDLVSLLESRFNAAAAQGVNAAIQFDFTGEQGGRYWLTVDNGTCAYGSGDVPRPASVTITCTAEMMLRIINNQVKPVAAFTMGRLKVSGDFGVAMKIQHWFPEE